MGGVAVSVVGLDPDPLGATLVVLEPEGESFRLRSWGLVRPPGAPRQHAYQIGLEDLSRLVAGGVVGVEVIGELVRASPAERGRLQATRAQGEALLELALRHAGAAFAFPGVRTCARERLFSEGPWPVRLTGLCYATRRDVRREVGQWVRGSRRWLDNPHVLDALGVALLAGRLAARGAGAAA